MVSIIIPTYNEEESIQETLSSFSGEKDIEIIVVDGGSTDRTAELAKSFSLPLTLAAKNRALQLNQGAKSAKGEIFLFLHADCRLEKGSLDAVRSCISQGFLGGCLSQKIRSSRKIYRLIEASGNLRARISKVFYGDQAIFVNRKTFFDIGGFDKVDLFEDVLFSKKLSKAGKTQLLNKKTYTSARRWEKQGIFKTTFINWLLTLGFIFRVPPRQLKNLYCDIR